MGLGFDGYVGTHVIDTVIGAGAAGMTIRVEREEGEEWIAVKTVRTSPSGHVDEPLVDDHVSGKYRFTFDFAGYFIRYPQLDPDHPYLDKVTLDLNLNDDPAGYFIVIKAAPYGFLHNRGG